MTDETSLEFHTRLSLLARASATVLVTDQLGGTPTEVLENFVEKSLKPFVLDPQVERFAVPEFISCSPEGDLTLAPHDRPIEGGLCNIELMKDVWAETSFTSPAGDKVRIGGMMLSMQPDQLAVIPLMGLGSFVMIPGIVYLIENLSRVDKATIEVADLFQRGEHLWGRPEVEFFEMIVFHFVDYLYHRPEHLRPNMRAMTGPRSASIH